MSHLNSAQQFNGILLLKILGIYFLVWGVGGIIVSGTELYFIWRIAAAEAREGLYANGPYYGFQMANAIGGVFYTTVGALVFASAKGILAMMTGSGSDSGTTAPDVQ